MEHHVYFAVFGFDHDPRQLDLLLGQSADDYWHEGESFSEAFPEARRRENRWILSSQLDHTASHRDHFEKLLYKLKRLSPQLQALDPGYRFDPAFYLPAEILEGYESLGFAITFDQLGLDHGTGN